MRISKSFLLGLFLFSHIFSHAMAEDMTMPNREQRQNMSYEEYAKFREQMRTQMDKNKSGEFNQNLSPSNSQPAQVQMPDQDRSYGKGYHSRNQTEDRPNVGTVNRPDRTRVERFNRGEMMRR